MTSTKILNIIRLCWRVCLPPHATQGQRKLLQSKGDHFAKWSDFLLQNYLYILMEVLYLRRALVPGPSYFCHLKFRNIISLWCEIDSWMWLLSFHASISICAATFAFLSHFSHPLHWLTDYSFKFQCSDCSRSSALTYNLTFCPLKLIMTE